jgi:alanyl-tRNA synthetase
MSMQSNGVSRPKLMKSSAELRQAFLDYFSNQGHTIVESSPLIPGNDPTLLFTNAGMVQFKDIFLGRETRDYVRAATAQRCVRAGGKHNDLENVGYTARHHTFFEMLGNFSFGDYFKNEAIHYAWDFLTRVLKIPSQRLWVTVYTDDDQAANIWLQEIGVDPSRFSRCGDHDNFWSMGETGPCGPCSEIFYDHGEGIPGGPPGSDDADGDRYVEIWNLVFMQYNRDASGVLTPLPKPSVDTGMGLERLAAVMQGVHHNYDIDLFQTLIAAAADLTGQTSTQDQSLRVIADHIRSASFLIADGVIPGNEGRNYVQRRIIRRAIRHGYRLGQQTPFLHRLVAPLVAEMGAVYPQLTAKQSYIEQVLLTEEERFADTLELGLRMFEDMATQIKDNRIPGDVIFRLYDTYGFPVDLTADIARERGLTLDLAGFEQHMAEQKQRARAASHFTATTLNDIDVEGVTDFTGYEAVQDNGTIVALYVDGQARDTVNSAETALVVLDVTPFYAESGGQVGDTGWLKTETAQFSVTDTQKKGDGVVCHLGHLDYGELFVGDRVHAHVDNARRQSIALHHSATHLLHAALRSVLGEHVQQRGSLVTAERLRFDFTHFQAIDHEQLRTIEYLVNRQIRANHTVETRIMDLQDAKASGAMALFGEKYASQVRVLRMGDFSIELCGGTHVRAVGDIGLFKIIAESGIAAGVRRIEAVAGERALQWVDAQQTRLTRIAQLIKATPSDAEDKIEQLLDRLRRLDKETEQLKAKLAHSAGLELLQQVQDINGIKLLAAYLDGADLKTIRETVDQLRHQLGSGIVVLATCHDNKANLIVGITRDLTDHYRAGDLVGALAPTIGGRGGGRPDMAQAGGQNPAGIPEALAQAQQWIVARQTAPHNQ